MKEGMVSTIIPVFNRAGMLREAVRSALAQSYVPIEVLIVDDGSTDETLGVAQELAGQNPQQIHVLSQRNLGPGAARNLGLAHAQGEFVQYLDSDDLLEPRKFEWQVRALRLDPEAGVAYGLTRRLDLASGQACDWARTSERISAIFPDFLVKRGWDTNSPLWRRSVCDAIGPWSELRCMEDWDHDVRAGLLGIKPAQVENHVATVRDHADGRASGMQSGQTRDMVRDMFRAHRGIWQRMQGAGFEDWSYLKDFSRKMFWIARACGRLGLSDEADEALEIGRSMAAGHRLPLRERLYRAVHTLLGWSRTERLALAARQLMNASKRHPHG